MQYELIAHGRAGNYSYQGDGKWLSTAAKSGKSYTAAQAARLAPVLEQRTGLRVTWRPLSVAGRIVAVSRNALTIWVLYLIAKQAELTAFKVAAVWGLL